MSTVQLTQPASLARRLAAATYDGLLVVAIWFAIAVIATPLLAYLKVDATLPLQVLCVLGTWVYFTASWARGGQTLAMKAWYLYVRVHGDDRAPSLTRASGRFVIMLLLCILPLTVGTLGLLPRVNAAHGVVLLLALPVISMLPIALGSRRGLVDYLSGTEIVSRPPRS